MNIHSQLARRLLLAGLVVILALGAGGCRRKRKAVAPPAPPAAEGAAETGLASWYGKPYHGRPTSSGEIYDMNTMTAAHRTLPFGTWVQVTNLENQLVTKVRINDRGPFIEGRIIDLSRAAAEEIAMLGPGTALVRLDILSSPAAPAAVAGRYAVQVGSFKERTNAWDLQTQLTQKYSDVIVQDFNAPDGTYYRVRVGQLATYDEAVALARQLGREPNVGVPMVIRLN